MGLTVGSLDTVFESTGKEGSSSDSSREASSEDEDEDDEAVANARSTDVVIGRGRSGASKR